MKNKDNQKEKFEKFSITQATIPIEKISFEELLKECKTQNKTPIILDTNFLFITFEFRIDLIREIERIIGSSYSLFIYEGTISELANIERKKDKNKRFIPLIITMLKRYNFKIIQSAQNYIDDQILSNLHKDVIIATNDKELKQSILSKGHKILYMRQKTYLELR